MVRWTKNRKHHSACALTALCYILVAGILAADKPARQKNYATPFKKYRARLDRMIEALGLLVEK